MLSLDKFKLKITKNNNINFEPHGIHKSYGKCATKYRTD